MGAAGCNLLSTNVEFVIIDINILHYQYEKKSFVWMKDIAWAIYWRSGTE